MPIGHVIRVLCWRSKREPSRQSPWYQKKQVSLGVFGFVRAAVEDGGHVSGDGETEGEWEWEGVRVCVVGVSVWG